MRTRTFQIIIHMLFFPFFAHFCNVSYSQLASSKSIVLVSDVQIIPMPPKDMPTFCSWSPRYLSRASVTDLMYLPLAEPVALHTGINISNPPIPLSSVHRGECKVDLFCTLFCNTGSFIHRAAPSGNHMDWH